MLHPTEASPAQLRDWAAADRYSFEEMALLADVQAFHARRTEARASVIRQNLHRQFRADSGFSAADLAYLLGNSSEPSEWFAALITEVRWQAEHADRNDPQQAFALSRIIHTLGSAIEMHLPSDDAATPGAFSRRAKTFKCQRSPMARRRGPGDLRRYDSRPMGGACQAIGF